MLIFVFRKDFNHCKYESSWSSFYEWLALGVQLWRSCCEGIATKRLAHDKNADAEEIEAHHRKGASWLRDHQDREHHNLAFENWNDKTFGIEITPLVPYSQQILKMHVLAIPLLMWRVCLSNSDVWIQIVLWRWKQYTRTSSMYKRREDTSNMTWSVCVNHSDVWIPNVLWR